MRTARIASLLLLMSLLGAAALARFAGPVVSTDKADYAPGSTVQISGSGFAANDTITLQIVHANGTNAGDPDHQPWTITADGQGGFSSTWYVNPDDAGGETFNLTAHGTDGSSATTTFTDSKPPKVDIQSPNSGNPFRFTATSLPASIPIHFSWADFPSTGTTSITGSVLQQGTTYGTASTTVSPSDNGSSTINVTVNSAPNGVYDCKIAGSNADKSDSKTEQNSIELVVPPILGTPPSDILTVFVGQNATFCIPATSNGGALTYQWYRDGAVIPGATSSCYTLTNAQLSDSGSKFKVVVTSDAGKKFEATSTSGETTLIVITPTTTTTVQAGGPECAGHSITFTATVAAGSGNPTGSVTFLDGGNPIGTGALSSGQATFTTSSLLPGAHFITASYPGDGTYGASVSSSVEQDIYDFSISASPNPLVMAHNQTSSFLITLAIDPNSAGTPAISLGGVSAPSGVTTSLTPKAGENPQTHWYLSIDPSGVNNAGVFNGNVSVTATPGGDTECAKTITPAISVVPVSVDSKLTNPSWGSLFNGDGIDVNFVWMQNFAPTYIQATNSQTIQYVTHYKRLGNVPVGGTLTLTLPEELNVSNNNTALGMSVFRIYGGGGNPAYSVGSTATPPAIRVYTSNPAISSSGEILVPAIKVNTTGGLKYQNVVGAPADLPKFFTFITDVKQTDSIQIPLATLGANSEFWVVTTLNYGMRGTAYMWPGDSMFTFHRGYGLQSNYALDFGSGPQPLSTPVTSNLTAIGSEATAVMGIASDKDGKPKSGLMVYVNGVYKTDTDTAGAYFVGLPIGTSGNVKLYNAQGAQVGSGNFPALAKYQAYALDFPGLSPADPVIQGIVSKSGAPLAGAKVELINNGNKVMAWKTTGDGGFYVFRFPQAGSFTVRVTTPAGVVTTQSTTVKMFETKALDFILK